MSKNKKDAATRLTDRAQRVIGRMEDEVKRRSVTAKAAEATKKLVTESACACSYY